MYASGKIDNSDLGYLLLERLYPIPEHFHNEHELQEFTRRLLAVIVTRTWLRIN